MGETSLSFFADVICALKKKRYFCGDMNGYRSCLLRILNLPKLKISSFVFGWGASGMLIQTIYSFM